MILMEGTCQPFHLKEFGLSVGWSTTIRTFNRCIDFGLTDGFEQEDIAQIPDSLATLLKTQDWQVFKKQATKNFLFVEPHKTISTLKSNLETSYSWAKYMI